jgi:hypothetical protein
MRKLLVLFLVLLAGIASATTYYVDLNGNDTTGDGSSGLPWKTITKAQSVVIAGDTVKFRTGNYGTFTLTNYSNSNWITYTKDTDATPVFTSISISNTTKDNIYLRFDGINIIQANPNYDPNDPSTWTLNYGLIYLNKIKHIEIKNAEIAGYSQYLTHGFYIEDCNNILVEHCDIHKVIHGFYHILGYDIYITQNKIHGITGSGIRTNGYYNSSDGHTYIERNYFYTYDSNKSDAFFPPDTLTLNSTTYPQGSPPAFQVGEEIWQPATGTATVKGTVMTWKWDGSNWIVYLKNCWPGSQYFDSSVPCKSQTTLITFTPTAKGGGNHPGAAVAARSWNVSIRKNIFRNLCSEDIFFEVDGTSGQCYSGMIVENNLFYDSANGTNLTLLNGTCIVRNNTHIGYVNNSSLSRSDIPVRYPSNVGTTFYSGFDGTGVEFYNNIFLGDFLCTRTDYPSANGVLEDYNIYWSNQSSYPNFINTTKGTHSKIAVWREPDPNLSPRGWPNYFENIGYIYQTGINVNTTGNPPYDYDYARDGITPFFVDPNFMLNWNPVYPQFSGGVGKVWDFHLIAGSPGINFGNSNNQPSDSLGSLDSDGFILDNGPVRDSSHHSIGAYEYGTSVGRKYLLLRK